MADEETTTPAQTPGEFTRVAIADMANSLDPVQSDLAQRMQQAEEAAEASRVARDISFLENVMPVLRQAHVDIVEVGYEGYGDSGGIEYVELIQAPRKSDTPTGITNSAAVLAAQLPDVESASSEWQGALVEVDGVEHRIPTVENCIHDYVYDMLSRDYGGWEINDGSTGNVVINLREGTVVQNHSARYTATEDFCTERNLRP
jgi:hypothetical protein